LRFGVMRIKASVLIVGLSGRRKNLLLVVLSIVSMRVVVRALLCLRGASFSTTGFCTTTNL